MKDSNMTRLAQNLRSNATPEENTLWYQYLRRHPVQFRRQHPFGSYIVDFYIASVKIVIELDGSQHFEKAAVFSDLCEKLAYMGVKLDPEKNKIRGEEVEISTPDSTVKVFVIPTNEELVIARDTKAIVEGLKK